MALNLSTLTSSATSGDVLAEALTTADFLEGCPVLRNLSRGSNKGGDAKQDVALNQPKALPLTKDSNGVLGGYLYQPDVTGNAPAVDIPSISANEDFVFEMEVYLVDATSFHLASGADASQRFAVHSNAFFFAPESIGLTSPLSTGASTLTVERSGTTATLKQDGVTKATRTANISDNDYDFTHLSFNVQYTTAIGKINGYIKKATLSIEGTQVFNCDFTATNVRHGDTKFKCATGQVVTVNQSGNDPATIIKKSVLRFDGVNDGFKGLFANQIDGGYMFAAFSVLGDGGESNGRVFSVDATGYFDYEANGAVFGYNASGNLTAFNVKSHTGLFDDANGDILQETKITNGSALSKVNNADEGTSSGFVINSSNFNVVTNTLGQNAAIDLEFLALFNPDSIPDEKTAQRIRNYINGRGAHPIFTLIDSAAYYFYDGTKSPVGAISSGSSAWSGRVVGSDNGDSASLLATQATSNDAPVGDGYVVTFADNTDHLDIPSISQAGWQIVGSSLGTFVYKINGTTAVTELNLLGNKGATSQRKAGDLYGIILLPESATSADIQSARRLLIDRGASDAATQNHLYAAWHTRNDIVEFQNIAMPQINQLSYAFSYMPNLVSFPAMSFPVGLYFANAWDLNTSMADFGAIQAPNGNNFSNAWKNTTALKSFPSGAKLGTAASSVDFSSTWKQSGLTSFPSLDLSNGATFSSAWNGTSSLLSFSASAKLGTNITNVSFVNAWINSGLTSFPALDLSTGNNFTQSWYGNSSLTDFSGDAKVGTAATNVNFTSAWRESGLTSFPALDLSTGNNFRESFQSCTALTTIEDGILLGTSSSSVDFTSAFKACTALTTLPSNLDLSKGDDFQTAFQNCQSLVNFPANAFDTMGTPQSYCFLNTWLDNNALSATSVENILVSINTCGQSAPSTGPEITIKYNTATGSLSAATNAAVTSLKAKGWSIIVNNVTL